MCSSGWESDGKIFEQLCKSSKLPSPPCSNKWVVRTCMYVCMNEQYALKVYRCMYVCTHVCIHVNMNIQYVLKVCRCMWVCVCMYVCMHVCTYMYVWTTSVCMYVCMYEAVMSISLLTQLFDVKMAVRIIDYDTLSHFNIAYVNIVIPSVFALLLQLFVWMLCMYALGYLRIAVIKLFSRASVCVYECMYVWIRM